MSEPTLEEIETRNAEIVTRFCKAWETRELEQLLPHLADHLYYKMWDAEDAIVVEDKSQFAETVGPFLLGMERVEFDILRTQAMGKIVINERHDRFVFESGDEWYFPVVGVFTLEDERIIDWRDYVTPTKPTKM